MRYTACACSRRNPRNSTRCEPLVPSEARSVAVPARTDRSALTMPTRRVTSSRSCQRMVLTSKPPRSLRLSTISRPLLAAISSLRCSSANQRICTAHASTVSPAISTERSCASGRSSPASSVDGVSFMSILRRARAGASFLVDDLGAELAQPGLDDARILRTHADQQLLPSRAVLEARIGVLPEDLRLLQRNRRRHLRSLQQVVDHFHETVVEVLAGVAEILVRLLKQRVQPLVHHGECLDVGPLHHFSERCVAVEVRLAQGSR